MTSTCGKRVKGIQRRVSAESTIPGNWDSFIRIDDNKNRVVCLSSGTANDAYNK